MGKPSKINQFAGALKRKDDLEVCERMLNTAAMYCNNPEVDSLISKALNVISNARTEYNDEVAAARRAAQKVTTIFIKDVPVEIPVGYDVKRVTMTGELRLNVYRAESRELLGQVMTCNRDGSDVGGFVVWKQGAQMPELSTSEHAALRLFLNHYLEA